MAADQQGNVYLGDHMNHRIRKVDPQGRSPTFAGTGESGHSGDGGPATEASIGEANAIAVDDDGNIFFADEGQHIVRKIDAQGIITTVAGTGDSSCSGDCGPALSAGISQAWRRGRS